MLYVLAVVHFTGFPMVELQPEGNNSNETENRVSGGKQALVETDKRMFVGVLEQEQIMAYSQSLQLAFKKCG